jgi:hypothetical protein
MAFYKQDPDRDDVIWIRVPLSADRTPTDNGNGKNIPIYRKAGWSEELYSDRDEWGPKGEPFKVDGDIVKMSLSLTIPNHDYRPQPGETTSKLSPRQRAMLRESQALVDGQKRSESDVRQCTLDSDVVLQDGTTLKAGTTVPSNILATVLTGMK